MPTVMIESLALGVPVIAFDCPTGPAEIIKTKEVGVLVEHLNVDALSHAILNYAQTPNENLPSYVEDFCFSNAVNAYLKMFGAK
jgi:glycosyltransferase involved in cell wall biosynthesis